MIIIRIGNFKQDPDDLLINDDKKKLLSKPLTFDKYLTKSINYNYVRKKIKIL